MPTLKTHTLGCKVNQYETELVREGLATVGYEEADREQSADLCVVNTCTVTNEGDSKSRQVIRKLARENPDSSIVVMGCYATRAPDELAALPNVTEVVTDKREIPDLLGRFGVVDAPNGISHFGRRHRAYVKVQDGCLLRCSYCIIPHVRPEMYSRPLSDVVTEVKRLADNGYREVVLTGIHLGHFGVEQNRKKAKEDWVRLADLTRACAKIDSHFRIRLSSIEATEVTRELLDVMAEHADRVCPHFHICLQSGSERILRKMRRRWGAKRFVDRCHLIYDHLPDAALTTDVIVGFPDETEADFDETLAVCAAARFSKIHIFPFSARKGTPAADMPNHVPKPVKVARGKRLAELESRLRDEYVTSLVGKPLQVLIEGESPEPGTSHVGTACRYLPIYLPTSQRSAATKAGDLIQVTASAPFADGLIAAN